MGKERADGFLTPEAVAKLKGVTVRSVRRALREGRLRGYRLGGQWITDYEAALAWNPTGRFIPAKQTEE